MDSKYDALRAQLRKLRGTSGSSKRHSRASTVQSGDESPSSRSSVQDSFVYPMPNIRPSSRIDGDYLDNEPADDDVETKSRENGRDPESAASPNHRASFSPSLCSSISENTFASVNSTGNLVESNKQTQSDASVDRTNEHLRSVTTEDWKRLSVPSSEHSSVR